MEEESYQEQGFIHAAVEIASKKNSMEMREKQMKLEQGLALIELRKPRDYQARQIGHQGYQIKKQRSFVTNAQALPTELEAIREKKPTAAKNKQKRQTLYQKYMLSDRFRMVYCRYNSINDLPGEQESNFAANYVYLGRVFDYNPNEYPLLTDCQPSLPAINQLQFDSNFQCGNLLYAFQNLQLPNEYHLILHNDTNSRGYTQWFYFMLRNHRQQSYRFRIVNMIKKTSLFSEGMKPWWLYGSAEGWKTTGTSISYEKSRIRRESEENQYYYQLSFDIDFQGVEGDCYIAMSPPYSYTKLIKKLIKFKEQSKNSMEIDVVAHTISSNCIPLVRFSKEPEENKKPIILFSARQHPGQTWSSYLMQGLLKYLSSDNESVKFLLQNYDVYLLPMVNVDGVIYGNFRCDTNGNDLNRRWRSPHKIFQNGLIMIKRRIEQLHIDKKIEFFFDLHGHSKKFNTFCYSCSQDQITCRILPLILEKIDKGFFFPDCTFNLDQSKINTARAILYELTKKETVMTIECSFFCSNKKGDMVPFCGTYMDQFAQNMLKAIFIYVSGGEVDEISRTRIEEYARKEIILLQSYQKNHPQDSGSDSQPDEFQLTSQQRAQNVMPRKPTEPPQIPNAVNRRTKIKPLKIKNKIALSEKTALTKIEESKELQSPIHVARRPRRETEHSKVRAMDESPIIVEDRSLSPRKLPSKYNIPDAQRKAISEINQLNEKIEKNREERRLIDYGNVFRQAQSQILLRQDQPSRLTQPPQSLQKQSFFSCSQAPSTEKPFYRIAMQYGKVNQSQKKQKQEMVLASKQGNSSLSHFDSKFSDYLIQKQQSIHYRKKDASSRRQEMEETVMVDKSREELKKRQKPALALLSKKFREEMESRKKIQQAMKKSYKPITLPSQSDKPRSFMTGSVKLGPQRQKRDTGLGQFSRVWRLNIKRYGKDVTQ